MSEHVHHIKNGEPGEKRFKAKKTNLQTSKTRIRTSINNPSGSANSRGDLLGEPGTETVVYTLGLSRGSSDTSSNSPHGLVGNDDLGPIVDVSGDGLGLAEHNIESAISLALLKGLSNTGNDVQAARESILDLDSNSLVGVTVVGAAFGVADDDPLETKVLDHLRAELTSVGSISCGRGVLGGDLDAVLYLVENERNMKGSGGDHDIHIRELRLVEAIDEGGNRGLGAVALPVASNENLSLRRHDSGLK